MYEVWIETWNSAWIDGHFDTLEEAKDRVQYLRHNELSFEEECYVEYNGEVVFPIIVFEEH